jgi:hypothetical protein
MYDIKEDILLGERVHIEALEKKGPRYNKNQTPQQRNSFENLMLMCPNHHTKIDKNFRKYTAKVLKKIKQEHEERQYGKISSDVMVSMVSALLREVQADNIGEQTASRMRPAELNFEKRNFDRILDRYERCSNINIKLEVLKGEIEYVMSTIPTNRSKWNIEVKEISKRLLEIGHREISSHNHMEHWLSNLSHIIKYGDKNTRKLYVETLRDLINKLYETQRPSRALIIIFQQVNRFSNSCTESLVNNSINIWSRQEFDSLIQFIDFKRRWKLNPKSMNKLLDKVLLDRNDAEQEGSTDKSFRLKRLDELIKNSNNPNVPPTFLV